METQLIKSKTKLELIRVIRINPGLYKAIRSFVESSLKPDYTWRLGYMTEDAIFWIKEGKWKLTIFKNGKVTIDGEKLPVVGIYKVIDSKIPIFGSLSGHGASRSLDFVIIKDVGIAVLNPVPSIVTLVFTREAPIGFISDVPFARPITVREILDTLSEYVEIS
jgi:hypothetical protein